MAVLDPHHEVAKRGVLAVFFYRVFNAAWHPAAAVVRQKFRQTHRSCGGELGKPGVGYLFIYLIGKSLIWPTFKFYYSI
jgi:hypothetical protein